jgi:hypothetical protein
VKPAAELLFRQNRNDVLIRYAVPCSSHRVCVWGVFDGGVMGWRATDLSENDAIQQAADLNVIFNQYGQREPDRLEVKPPIEVESATWSTAGMLDYWVKEEREWWGRVRGPEGRQTWIRAVDLRRASSFNQ